jgi:uncharacterized membrane protein YfcA
MLSARKLMVVALAFAVIAAPVLAQSSETDTARMAAEADAKSDVSTLLWMGAGFLFNLLGVGAAYIIVPSPPASRLLGKSSEYVAVYTDSYQSAARNVQVKNALIGCAISAACGLLTTLVYWAAWGGWWWAYAD